MKSTLTSTPGLRESTQDPANGGSTSPPRHADVAGSLPSILQVKIDDHLLLRTARPDEAETLVDFNTRIFDERITDWSRDLLSGSHPTVRPSDFTVVEDTRSGEIVSSLCLISQTWACRGVPFGVGRGELVATRPDYRRRGLVRKQFEALHTLSAAKGERLQVIAGVEWFYRQFGYEMGVQMAGNRCLEAAYLSSLPEGTGRLRLRQASTADYAFIRNLYQSNLPSQPYAAVRSPGEWEYEFSGRAKGNTRRREWLIIEDMKAERLGFVQYLPCLASPQWRMFRIYQVELVPGVCYLNATPILLRALWDTGRSLVQAGVLSCAALEGIELALERDHPFLHALPLKHAREIKASPWYIRVPDMAGFLHHIRSGLERNLEGTIAAGYSGELKISFFRSGIRMVFEGGRLVLVENWKPEAIPDGDARFPNGSFLQLVCGWRRVHQLSESFPECSASDHAALILDSLFPPFNGKVWMLA